MPKTLLTHHRPQWRTHIGFILAAIGSAVGLGNIWRFPYLCYKNGGGAFLIPYFTALLVVGLPLMILEISLGHKMRGSAPAAFADISSHWEWLGWWQVIFVMFGIVLYYSVVIAWCLNYFYFSFNLSWGHNPNHFFFHQFLAVSKGPFDWGNIRPQILFSLGIIWFLNWLIVFLGVEKGLERANKIFMPLLFILTAFLVFWSLRLPGAREGLEVYLRPDFNKLKQVGVWLDAFSQIFFTLSLGFGIMIAYASYLPRRSQIVKDATSISLVNCFFSIFAGLGVFAILGYMSYQSHQPIDKVVTQAVGLAFVSYPQAISLLPAFASLFGVVFFGILVIAGLSSSISIMEAFTSAVIDKFNYRRRSVVSVLAVSGFLGSIIFATQAGLLLLDIVDHFLTQYGLVLAGLLEALVVGWFWGAEKLRSHINSAAQASLPSFWDWTIKAIIPFTLGILFINALIKEFSAPYGQYPSLALILVGRDWLLFTLFFAVVIAARHWANKE